MVCGPPLHRLQPPLLVLTASRDPLVSLLVLTLVSAATAAGDKGPVPLFQFPGFLPHQDAARSSPESPASQAVQRTSQPSHSAKIAEDLDLEPEQENFNWIKQAAPVASQASDLANDLWHTSSIRVLKRGGDDNSTKHATSLEPIKMEAVTESPSKSEETSTTTTTTEKRQLFHYPGYLSDNADGTDDVQTAQDGSHVIVVPATSTLSNTTSQVANCSFTVTNVTYSKLIQDHTVLHQTEAALKEAIAHEAGSDVTPEDVELRLSSAGNNDDAVRVNSRIFTEDNEMVQWNLNTTTSYETSVQKSLAKVDNLETVTTGDIHVVDWLASLRGTVEDSRPWWDLGSWYGFSKWLWLGLLTLAALMCCMIPLLFLMRGKTRKKRTRGLHGHDKLTPRGSARTVTDASGSESEDDEAEDDPRGHQGEVLPLIKGDSFVHGQERAMQPMQSTRYDGPEYDLVTVTDGGIAIHPLRYGPPPGVPIIVTNQ